MSIQTSWILWFLATSPSHRDQLQQQPHLIPQAIQELIRRFSGSNIARVVRDDCEFHGVQLKAGDGVLLPTFAHGLDEQSFEFPFQVNFSRPDAAAHSAFSYGIHSCPGKTLSLLEIQIFVEEWLRVIPHFTLDEAAVPSVESGLNGVVYQLFSLPLCWPTSQPSESGYSVP